MHLLDTKIRKFLPGQKQGVAAGAEVEGVLMRSRPAMTSDAHETIHPSPENKDNTPKTTSDKRLERRKVLTSLHTTRAPI